MTKYAARVMSDEEGDYVILPKEMVDDIGLQAGTNVRLCKRGDVITVTPIKADEPEPRPE
jgi:antitoxin component of MazEF toxin-antitoxin module